MAPRLSVFFYSPGDDHWQGLLEVGRGIAHASEVLGLGGHWNAGNVSPSGRLVYFNAHRLPPGSTLKEDTILYNAEQVPTAAVGERWQVYLDLLRRHVVWDYCDTNIARLRALGVERVVKCPVGYWPGLETVPPCANEDVDVLFVGSMNDRREAVLQACRRRGLKVSALFDCYGTTRDEWMARAKIILNVHYYAEPIFEIFRVSHALANRKCVVSEGGGVDGELEAFAKRSVYLADPDGLADACRHLVDHGIERKACAESGYAMVKQLDQVAFVRAALEQS